jgi:hypothetical protein
LGSARPHEFCTYQLPLALVSMVALSPPATDTVSSPYLRAKASTKDS